MQRRRAFRGILERVENRAGQPTSAAGAGLGQCTQSRPHRCEPAGFLVYGQDLRGGDRLDVPPAAAAEGEGDPTQGEPHVP